MCRIIYRKSLEQLVFTYVQIMKTGVLADAHIPPNVGYVCLHLYIIMCSYPTKPLVAKWFRGSVVPKEQLFLSVNFLSRGGHTTVG